MNMNYRWRSNTIILITKTADGIIMNINSCAYSHTQKHTATHSHAYMHSNAQAHMSIIEKIYVNRHIHILIFNKYKQQFS